MKTDKNQNTEAGGSPDIRFERLSMHRSYDGKIIGKLSIKSNDGSEVKIALPDEPLEAIVDLVAGKLAEAAKVQADRLRDAILNRNNNQINQ